MRVLLGSGRIAGLLLLALSCTGCLSWMDRTERKLDRVAGDTAELRWEQQKLAEEVEGIASLLDSEGLVGDERRAELLTRLRTVEQTLDQLKAQSQEQELLLRRMSAALDQLLRQPVIPAPPATDEPAPEFEESAVEPDSEPEAPPELLLYDAAMSDFRSGNTLLARQGFEELVYLHPNSDLADNAAYWLAETLFAERDYRAALARYREVEELYPTTEMLSALILKLGYTQVELGNDEAAALEFRRLLQDFPDGEEAAMAAHQLELLESAEGGDASPDVEPLPDLPPEESGLPQG